jgi:acyl-CoA synthetase (AMP-forming)/AMP-acid ligase II
MAGRILGTQTPEPRFSFAYDVLQQSLPISQNPAWIAQLAVGQLRRKDGFVRDAQNTVESLVQCVIVGNMFGMTPGPIAAPLGGYAIASGLLVLHRASGEIEHARIGDVGRLDDEGRLWFLGRKSQRLETEHGVLYPVPLENAFDVTRGVERTALVGVGPRGAERPVLVIESAEREYVLLPRLRQRSAELVAAPGLPPVERFLFHPHFPVDARHNAKIRREELKRWAEGRLPE